MLIFPEDEHERFLIERKRENGVRIDRPTEVVGFERANRVAVRLKRPDGSDESCEAAFLRVAMAISSVRNATRLSLPAFPWQEAMGSIGFVRNAV